MALIKEIMTESGPVSFWVISLLQLDNFAKRGYIRLYGFYNKEHADMLNAQPTGKLELTVPEDIYGMYFDPWVLVLPGRTPHGMAYALVKNSDIDLNGRLIDFSDAEDSYDEVRGEINHG